MDDTPQVHDKLFRLPHEIGMQVGLHAANHIVVLNQPSSGGILENVENHLTLPEAIEERRQRSHVHGQTGIKQEVGIDTLQFVHYRADILRTFGNLDTRGLLDTHAQGMAALVGAQVVQTVGQRQRLRISQALVHLFDTPVDISQYGVYLLDHLAVQRRTHTQYAMCGRMLRADIDNEVIRAEHHVLAPFDGPVRTQVIFFRHVGVFFILHVERVAVHVIILAERITRPILTQVEAAHVGMPREAYAEEIVCLAFLDFRRLPYPAHRGQERILAPVRVRSQRHAAARPRRLQLVEHAQTAVSVRRHKVPHEVHRFFRVVVQPAAYLRHVPIRDHYHSLAGLFHRGGRTPLPYLFFYHTPASFLSPASSGFSLWLRPPRKRSILILRCNCIIP